MAVESELIVSVQDNIDEATRNVKSLEDSYAGLGKEASKTDAYLRQTQRQLEAVGNQARIVGAALTAAFVGATKVFSDFDKSATNVQNIIDGTAQEINVLKQAVMGLPPELGDATDLMNALYQTISSGIPQGNALEFLELHAKAAKGNLADLTQTVDAGSSIMNAYGLSITEMSGVLDAMTKTVDLGKVTFQQLSENIGQGISIAASAGVTYQELLGVLASLTLNGLGVDEAMTSIRNILVKVLKPGKDSIKMANQLGIEFSASAIQAKGFAQWMGEVATATEGNAEMVTKLFPNIRALNGAMKLASEEGGAKYNDILNQIINSSGKVENNFARMSQSMASQTDAMVNELKKLGIEFGALASEFVLPLIQGIRGVITAFRELSPEQKQNIIDIGKMTLAISGALIVIPKLISGYLAISGAIKGLAAARAIELAQSKLQTAQWRVNLAQMAVNRAGMIANTAATTASATANTGLVASLRASQAAMATQRAIAAGATAQQAAMSASIAATNATLGLFAVALAGAYAIGKGLEVWFDSMNHLTAEFKTNLEEVTNQEIEFAKAAKELGVSASALIKEHGSLEEALRKVKGESGATREELERLDGIYNKLVSSQEKATEELGRFEQELAERGILGEVLRDYETLAKAYTAAADKKTLLGIALEKVREDMKAEAQAAKEAAEAQKKEAEAHEKTKAAILAKADALLKDAKASKKALEQTEKKLSALNKEIEARDKYAEDHKKFIEEMEKANESFADNLEEYFVGAWEKVPAPVKAAIEAMKEFANKANEVKNTEISVTVDMPRMTQIMGELSGLTTSFGQTFGDAIYDGIQGNLPSLQTLFRGFSQDIGDYLYTSLSGAINDAFSEAAQAMEGGGEGGEGGMGAGVQAFFGKLDKDFWLDAGAAISTAFMGRSQQKADKLGSAIAGAMAGAMIGTKILPGIGTVIGAVIGAIVGYFGASKADTPRVRAGVGYTRPGLWSGFLETRDQQLFTDEMERTWLQQQAAIFDALKMGYRSILESFGDPQLLADLALADLPKFEMPVGEWMEASASDLATYLKETYWPQAFRDYFSAALEAGLGRYGVTESSVAALMGELERLPGQQTMQALADFVQAVVGSAKLLEGMDFESIWQEVIQSPRAAMAAMGEEIINQIQVWSSGWEALTGIEQARQLIKITDLVSQAREAEIQYLRQIYQVQQQINRAIFDQIEQLRLGGMTETQQATYAWDRLQEIFAQLQSPDIDASQLAQLTADAQNYIRLLEQLMGEDLDTKLFGDISDPFIGLIPQDLMQQWRGLTGREGLIKLLEYLQSLSDIAVEGEISDSEARLAEYNRLLGEANALLLTFGDILRDIIGVALPGGPVIDTETPDPTTQPPGGPTDPDSQQQLAALPTNMQTMITNADPANNPLLSAINRMSSAADALPAAISLAMKNLTLPAPQLTVLANVDGSIAPLISIIDARIAQWETGSPVGGMG